MIYVGETVRIKTSVASLDGETYLPAVSPNEATIEFFDESGEVAEFVDSLDVTVDQPVDMNADTAADPDIWYYDWTPLGLPAGIYYAKITITGTGFEGTEYKKIRLREAPYVSSNC